jgi:PHD/YefM family antitoxin component YafN of YafNO toxin-antitoxin module
MVSAQHTQSLSEFRDRAAETLDRLNRTGEAEVLTVNGEARAVLIAPAVYDELARELEVARDAAVIRQSMKEFDDGKGLSIEEAHQQLRGDLRAMKAIRDAEK